LARLGGAAAFPDAQAIVASGAVTHDGRFGLLGDANLFSGIPNRVAVVSIAQAALAPVQVLSPISDPEGLVTSPFDDVALVLETTANQILVLTYTPGNAQAPFAPRGPLAYTGAAPQLPAVAQLLTSGSLAGRVLVAENLGIRQVTFAGGG